MKQTLRDLAILAALAFTHSATAGLPGSMSGTWYNPAQSGHGLSLDVLAADRAVAIWHVFDADGQPVTLYIDGHLDGRLLTGPAYAPVGMRFGSFDPAELQLPVWGQVAIDFSSCDQAQLELEQLAIGLCQRPDAHRQTDPGRWPAPRTAPGKRLAAGTVRG